jgi:hypothetical protein
MDRSGHRTRFSGLARKRVFLGTLMGTCTQVVLGKHPRRTLGHTGRCILLVVVFSVAFSLYIGIGTMDAVKAIRPSTSLLYQVTVRGGSNTTRVYNHQEEVVYPRVARFGPAEVHLHGQQENSTTVRSRTVNPLGAPCCEEYKQFYMGKWDSDDCEPMASWQTHSFPTCNTIHERDLATFYLNYLGKGWLRVAWLDQDYASAPLQTNLVFRTARNMINTHGEARLELPMKLHQDRLESLALERLTSSPRIINEYAYCALAMISEFAINTMHDAHISLNRTTVNNEKRLELGYQAALIMSDIQSIDTDQGMRPTLAHGDFSVGNILLMEDGRLVSGDFNQGVMLHSSKSKGGNICKFAQSSGFNTYHSFKTTRAISLFRI